MDNTDIESKRNRVKYAFVNYADIPTRIQNGEIDEYDIVFTKDTHEQYLIKDDLTPLRILTRVNCFDSIDEAVKQLNEDVGTYNGQLVAINDNESNVYHGYIVNSVNGKFTVTSLSDSGQAIDYNSLSHIPIINKVGEIGKPIIVGSLDEGVYSITGQYKIFNEFETVFSTSVNHLMLVNQVDENIYVKDIFANEIITYILSGGIVSQSKEISQDYLKNNYISNTSFDEKIKALNFITKEETASYVEELVNTYLDSVLDAKIEEKINEKIVYAEESDITTLFETT